MTWPTSQDYNEAIQNPASSFLDPGLKGGEVAVNALGLPVPRSGNFADVYQFKGGDGKTWAIKCFTRRVAGLQERYAKIDEHIGRANFPFTVGFKYLSEGIRVRGEWFPVLKMEWVEGFTLNEFVRDNADKPKYLAALLQMWPKLTARLRDANFAHADLQHGNVLLVPGGSQSTLGLRLIDYDGMWVPALAEHHSGEIGHPNFQHPFRLRDRLYNADVDRFPHLVVASALRATVLGGRPLWEQFDNGDNLLFKESDFRDPADAPVFKTLWGLQDDVLCALLGKLVLATREPLRKTPWLDDLLLDEDAQRLTDDEEKKVLQSLGVGPHFTAAKIAAAAAMPSASEAPQFEALTSDEEERPASRREERSAHKKRKPVKRERQAKSPLPYYIGGGVAAVALIGGIFAIASGRGSKTTAPESQLVKNLEPALETKVVRPQTKKGTAEERKEAPKKTGPETVADPKKSDQEALVEPPKKTEPKVVERPKRSGPPQRVVDAVSLSAGDKANIENLSYSRDGKLLAAGSKAGGIYLWNTAANAPLKVLRGHTAGVIAVGFNSDGTRLVSAGSDDQTTRIWDIKSGRQLFALKSSFEPTGVDKVEKWVSGAAFSPDDKFVAAGGGNRAVTIWDARTGAELKALAGHKSWIWCVAFSPKSNVLASSSADRTIKLWDIETGKEIKSLTGHQDRVRDIAFSPDGKRLASSSWDKTVRVWDVESGQELCCLKGHGSFALSTAFSPNGKYVASCGADHFVRLWDAETGDELVDFVGHIKGVGTLAFSPDGRWLASGGADQIVRVFEIPASYVGGDSSPGK
jgi:hypothetical protein